jgi:hypothetical protein
MITTRAVILPLIVLVATATASGCAGRRPPLPQIEGRGGDVVIRSSFEAAPGPERSGELLIDSVAFGRLLLLMGEGTAPAAAGRLVDPRDVLECPDREPCRVRGDATFLTVWDALLRDDGSLSVVVSRAWNVQGLYAMTRHVTHRLELRRGPAGWRLNAREQISP